MDSQNRNGLLRELLPVLAARKIAKIWAAADEPYAILDHECRTLGNDAHFLNSLSVYLNKNPIIHQSVLTLLATIAMAANTRWEDTPQIVQVLSRRGWHIARWIPTFLIVDGPIGRLFKDKESPIADVLKSQYSRYPILAQARDIFNHDEFRLIRNGIGHWAFIWEDNRPDNLIHIFDEKSNKHTLTITILEAEAFHLVAFSIVEILNTHLLTPASREAAKSTRA